MDSASPPVSVEPKIYRIRGLSVMLDHDLADLYQIPTGQLNQQVKRNPARFPGDFMFTLSNAEFAILRSQNVTSSHGHGGRRRSPLAFTEQGVAMLSSVLSSPRAIEVNVLIMRTFVKLRESLLTDQELARQIAALEQKYSKHDRQFQVVFDAIKDLIAGLSEE
ncbi:MAG: ORF6N domain-containing protein [Bacteriovoracia bacterium]